MTSFFIQDVYIYTFRILSSVCIHRPVVIQGNDSS